MINLYNQGQMDAGVSEKGQGFYLCLNGVSNPDGAKVYVNGAPLINSIYYWILPGEASFTNPHAATNMTMIARVEGLADERVSVYVGDELAAVAEPKGSLYFLTIQSDRVGELRFEMGGETLMPFDISTSRHLDISNIPDSHHGSLKAPIILRKDDNRPYKIIEDDHVIIIRNKQKYDVTGIKL
ncbi:MAG: hypothetical protein J6T76_05680 [Paludibacteraceae bacterium]|nr:hypothetical protein [Paludibacteraceae bacterium]